MPYAPEEVFQVLETIAKEMKLEKVIQTVIYKADFGEYQIVLDDIFHCVLRERIVDSYISSEDKDSLRDIKYNLQHAAELSEWETLDQEKKGKKNPKDDDDDIILED